MRKVFAISQAGKRVKRMMRGGEDWRVVKLSVMVVIRHGEGLGEEGNVGGVCELR